MWMIHKMFRDVLLITFISSFNITFAQTSLNLKDSTTVSIKKDYDGVSRNHRLLFGENYRKEWAAETRLPIIKISQIRGGLKPIMRGGGHQSHTLRLEEASGKEWVLRISEKYSEGLTPELLKGTVYSKWLEDNFSAQHPYSSLIVPVLADAVKVLHTNPLIGWVAPDPALGIFAEEFAGKICLLEEREPAGDSDNTSKMLAELQEDNDHQIDSAAFFRARLLDLLIADWGRHEDQWRWTYTQTGAGKNYEAVPRDRDQALYLNEGILPGAVSNTSLLSFLEGFNGNYKDPNSFFINGRKLNQQFLNQYSYEDWMHMTREFVAALPDRVLKQAVRQLPASSYALRGDVIFTKLQGRRDNLLSAMDTYYKFLYSIIDVRTSDKAELIEFTETSDRGVNLNIHKLSASGEKDQMLFNNVFKPDITREIRLFAGGGKDVIRVNLPASPIRLRIVGGENAKSYDIKKARKKVDVYENLDGDRFSDPAKGLHKHLSDDTLNTRKVFSDLYPGSGISPEVDLRSVDDLFLGLSYKIEKEGFRKEPFGSKQKITALHSLSTKSFIVKYQADWKDIFKNTDLTVHALADMKGNIQNFFGRGNDTYFDRTGDFSTFYRVNFSFYKLEPAFKVNLADKIGFSIGPSFQYFSRGTNTGRFIETPEMAASYSNLFEDKSHGGLFVNLSWDKRNNTMLPSKGINFSMRLHAYEGLNKNSGSFSQIIPSFSFYKSLDEKGNIVIADRIGGAITFGETAFFQSAFLGSQDNLLGFRKYRFAGDHVLYNNLEIRINLPDFLHYFMPGKIGLIGFYDAGRVWVKNEVSDTIHHGIGGGIYLAPFNRFFIRAVAGFSKERWQPTVSLKQRF